LTKKNSYLSCHRSMRQYVHVLSVDGKRECFSLKSEQPCDGETIWRYVSTCL